MDFLAQLISYLLPHQDYSISGLTKTLPLVICMYREEERGLTGAQRYSPEVLCMHASRLNELNHPEPNPEIKKLLSI